MREIDERTLSSASFESLLFLKSSISFSRRVTSAFAACCLSFVPAMMDLKLATAERMPATSATICSGYEVQRRA